MKPALHASESTAHTAACNRPTVVACPTLDALQACVHAYLCQLDHLDQRQSPIRRTLLRRGGVACGMVFHVEGPRLLRNSAVWSADEARVLLYSSTGVRAGELHLSEAPALPTECAIPTQRAA